MRRLEKIQASLEKFAEAGDVEKYFEYNCLFHELVQKLAVNSWLERTLNDLRKFLKLMRGRQLHLPGRLQASLAEHREILAAFQRRDAEAAAAAAAAAEAAAKAEAAAGAEGTEDSAGESASTEGEE